MLTLENSVLRHLWAMAEREIFRAGEPNRAGSLSATPWKAGRRAIGIQVRPEPGCGAVERSPLGILATLSRI